MRTVIDQRIEQLEKLYVKDNYLPPVLDYELRFLKAIETNYDDIEDIGWILEACHNAGSVISRQLNSTIKQILK